MGLEQKLAEERRARLAAERLLEQKSRELFDANRKLAAHARHLSEEINETKQVAEELRGKADQAEHELAVVSEAYAIAERRLWDSLETIRDGFAVFDGDDRLVAANRAFLGLFDGLEEVSLGVRYCDVVRLMAEEGIVDPEGMAPSAWVNSMTNRWAQDRVPDRVIRLWNGQYIKLIERRTPDGDMVCLNLDITEMMRMWAAVEVVEDGFVLFDHEDRLLMCNARYRETFGGDNDVVKPGVTFEEILRHGLEQGLYKDAAGREEEWLSDRLNQHQRADMVIEQELSDGRWLRVLDQATPDGGRVGLRVDITDQKRQQKALDDARIAAEAASRAKTAFFANMSHELRTPMNGVVGMAELLCDGDLTEEQRLYAETIRTSGEALLGLLNDVLDYSKIEAEKLSLVAEPFDLEKVIQDVVTLLKATARDKDLELRVDYDMFLPTGFVGDRGRIRQILTNLIGNAVKFTEKGHVLVRVVGLDGDAPDQRQVHITVEDTGIGIAPELQEHIFGEFNQVDDQQNRKFEGTGLGLAITRRLVELMGGGMWVKSEIGQGACFGFSLPLALSEQESSDTVPAAFSKVLVVDGDDNSRHMLEGILSQAGFSCRAAATCYDAHSILADGFMPELLVVDFTTCGVSTGAFPAYLNAFEHPVRTIALVDDDGDLDVDLTLRKPVTRADLIREIAKLDPPERVVTPRRMRILAAEDNKTNRLVFSKMVAGLNIDLRFAENGLEAVDGIKDFAPDLVFMDISMPEMDGKEATRTIRLWEAENARPRTPIIAVTAHALAGDADEILAAGLDHYMTKPLKKPLIRAQMDDHRPLECLPLDPPEKAEKTA